MKTFSNDRELYLAYRLGELLPGERDALDERMLTDGDFSDRMQETEYDLLDDYRAGRLDSDVQLRTERAFSRDELRQPLPFASRTNGQHEIAFSSSTPRLTSALRFAGAAAALVLIAAAGWVIAFHFHSGAVSSTSAAHNLPPSSSLPQNSGNSSTETTVSSSQLSSETAVVLLAPAVTRGSSSAQLELRAATRMVLVQWVVPSDLSGRKFSLLVQQNGKEIAWVSASNLQRIGGSDVEEFSVPRRVFSATGTRVHYVFLIRESAPMAATKAEFFVHVSEDF